MSRAKELYGKVEVLRKELYKTEQDMVDIRNCLEKAKIEYRRESVNRILDYVRSEYRAGRVCDLEILLCHCQNKLNGNLDGVELDIEDGHLAGVPFVKGGGSNEADI